jgi:DNA-binding winged helix-turn-helix (wHTH) protein/predicted negative regulator of RcsB-dependent stress response
MSVVESRSSKDVRFRVGDWTLDPVVSRLERRGEEIHLEPRLTELLCHFSRHPRRVISKEELIDKVWQGRSLDGAAIARAVAELRKALGDTAQDPRYIETIPKRGYRLVADVKRGKHRLSRSFVVVAAAVILVLAFLLLRSKIATQSDSDAMESPTAISGTSNEQALEAYRLAAKALDRGGQASNESAVVHLTRALELDPDFALARAGLAEAYSVRATWYGSDGDWAGAALVEASRAVALAPELPESHRALGSALSTNLRFGEAEVSYRRALELRPEDEEIAFRLGEILSYRGEWPEALEILSSLGPESTASRSSNCEIAALLFGLDYTAEARARLEAALALQPFQMCANIRLAHFDLVAGELESARVRTERLSAARAACDVCELMLGEVAYRQDRSDAAASHFALALERTAEPKSTAMRIRLAQLEGDTDALHTVAASLERKLTAGVDIYFPASLLAVISAELGDTAGALRWHQEATARGHLDWRSDLAEPTFELLLGTSEFESAIAGIRSRVEEMRSEVESRGLMEKLGF